MGERRRGSGSDRWLRVGAVQCRGGLLIANNLAKSNLKSSASWQRLFYIEAVKYNVLPPLDNSKVERLDVRNRPSNIRGLNAFTYYDGMVRIPEGGAPDLKNKSFGISAVVDIPQSGASLLATRWTLCGARAHVREGTAATTLRGVERYTVSAPTSSRRRRHVITVDFNYDGGGVGKGGEATLSVDGKKVASEKLRRTIGYRMCSTRRLTSVKTLAHPPARITTCHSSLPASWKRSPSTSRRKTHGGTT